MNADAAVTDKRSTLPWPMQLAVPVASLITFGTHLLIAQKAPPLETRSYMLLFWEILGVSIVLAIVQPFWPALRKWMRHMGWQHTVSVGETGSICTRRHS